MLASSSSCSRSNGYSGHRRRCIYTPPNAHFCTCWSNISLSLKVSLQRSRFSLAFLTTYSGTKPPTPRQRSRAKLSQHLLRIRALA
eukprot:6042517-Pyramimonas_sp.AAC.1